MSTPAKIDAWDKAHNDLKHAHEFLKQNRGTQHEVNAQTVWKMCLDKYNTASTALDEPG
ncbi:hypothetical protein D3C72_779830 [compost metagenome]